MAGRVEVQGLGARALRCGHNTRELRVYTQARHVSMLIGAQALAINSVCVNVYGVRRNRARRTVNGAGGCNASRC